MIQFDVIAMSLQCVSLASVRLIVSAISVLQTGLALTLQEVSHVPQLQPKYVGDRMDIQLFVYTSNKTVRESRKSVKNPHLDSMQPLMAEHLMRIPGVVLDCLYCP
jgi:hypothetical protein